MKLRLKRFALNNQVTVADTFVLLVKGVHFNVRNGRNGFLY